MQEPYLYSKWWGCCGPFLRHQFSMSTSIDITEVDQFANLLETLTVPNNVIRQAGEKQYTLLKENDGGLLSFLLLSVKQRMYASLYSSKLQVVRLDRYEPNIRRLAAVLLRRIVIQDENSVYDQIDEQGYQLKILYYTINLS